MILPRMEGGVGLRNLEELHISVAIKRATRAWSHDEIWAQWIQRHYFHNQYIARTTEGTQRRFSNVERTLKVQSKMEKSIVCS